MSPEAIDDAICEIMVKYGPDRHVDGHEVLTDYVLRLLAAERERCAKIAEQYGHAFEAAEIRKQLRMQTADIADAVAAEPVVSVVVLLNPITKQPTCFEPSEAISRIFYGPYQNVTRVTKEWQTAERKRVDAIFYGPSYPDSQDERERQHLREMMPG